MKRRVSHSTQREIFVYIVPIAVVVVTRKLCANKKPQTMHVTEITLIPGPYLTRRLGGCFVF